MNAWVSRHVAHAATAIVGIGALAAALVASPAIAQETGGAAAEKKVQYWFKICPSRADAEGKEIKICVTQHEQFNQRSGELNVAMAIRQQDGKKPKLLVTVPLGVALPTGAAVQFDKIKEPIKFTYVFCHAEGCVIDTEATPQIVDAMKAGASANISVFHTFYNRPVSFNVPLKGFTATLDGDPVDGNQYFQRRRQLRLAIRKRTSDAIKKAQEEQKKKAGATE
ncbi:MAG: invasion associated locus B family protein [Pseudomonadota bacterium]